MENGFDLVIRGGTLVDGSGDDPYLADVAVSNGRIAAIGNLAGRGREEIDAAGQIVTPGFVDIHTHYDGQATWENRMAPSSSHGVTTVVTGNCGVGFAPCRPQDREELVALMEGVEDVPGIVMAEGLPWTWQSFPEYLDVLDRRQYDVDIATQLPHSCLRVYVMGERGIRQEAADERDLAEMTRITREAMQAGAIGFGTSRSPAHRFLDGRPIPTKDADEAELEAIARGMQEAGHGVIEALIDQQILVPEFEMLCRVSQRYATPFSMTLLQNMEVPDGWRDVLTMIDRAARAGVNVKAQVIGRPTGLLLGLDVSLNPFTLYPSYKPLAHLPLPEKVRALRAPEMRARMLAELPTEPEHPLQQYLTAFSQMFPLCDPPQYEPALETSIAAQARAAGVSPQEIAYDAMLEDEGHALIFAAAANFAQLSLDPVLAMLKDPHTVLGLGDGGAHYGMICDAGYPTFMLTHWTRDRAGEKLSLPHVVRALTNEPAVTVGLCDRGRIAPGYRADINIIDYDRLELHAPRVAFDLPAGGRRLKQSATGYSATIVRGTTTYRNGTPTGALPGRLVRGPQTARDQPIA